MPIYEYQCTGCHHKFDLLQKINEEPAKKCPQCSKNTAVRLVSAAGFQLKGTGWYVTDFKNKGSSAASSTSADKKSSDKTTASTTSNTSSSSKKGETD